MAHPTRYS
jgi:hypothetical protein